MELLNLPEIGSALFQILNLKVLLWIFVGSIIGLVFGATPGLTATTAVALFTPITFGLSYAESFGFLLGIYCCGYYSGSIPAILIKTPGAPGNAATTMDGYPMAQKGRAGEALTHSVFSSFIGGIFSCFALLLFAPMIAQFALKFGPPEYFAIAILGMSAVASISGKSILKGFIAGMLGIILGCVGLDPIDGLERFTFGTVSLMQGIGLIPAVVGLFALTEVFQKTLDYNKSSGKIITQIEKALPDLKLYWSVKWLLLKSIVIGVIIGAIPGTGPTVASWISYNEAKRTAKHPEEFGAGSVEGIIACESSNNAVTGGAIIPMVTLGIPGDGVTAVLLSALLIQGLTPGPMLLKNNFSAFAMIIWILLFSNLFMLLFGLLGSKYFPKMFSIPIQILLPIILVLCVAGSYAVANSVVDISVALLLGIIGFILVQFGFPVAPMVLGLILGPIIEPNFRLALIGGNMSPLVFASSPICVLFLLLSIILLALIVRREQRAAKSEFSQSN